MINHRDDPREMHRRLTGEMTAEGLVETTVVDSRRWRCRIKTRDSHTIVIERATRIEAITAALAIWTKHLTKPEG